MATGDAGARALFYTWLSPDCIAIVVVIFIFIFLPPIYDPLHALLKFFTETNKIIQVDGTFSQQPQEQRVHIGTTHTVGYHSS